MKNKMIKLTMFISIFSMIFMVGCMKPPRVDPIEDINPNETAFVIPLEGDTLNQGSFDSIQFLEEKKVATKRITIPQRERRLGRAWQWWKYEWIPTVKVIKVNRQPITREWTAIKEEAKNSAAAIEVESGDSIGFKLGVNITAMVEEPDTAAFLYYYPQMSLATVIDTNIRGDIQTVLSSKFGERELQEAKNDKNIIFQETRDLIVDKFKEYGITITSFGLAQGLEYDDVEIQKSINDAYVAEMRIKQREQEMEAQKYENERLLSIASNERKQAEEFAKAAEERKKQVEVEVMMMNAKAFLTLAEAWDGKSVPYFISNGGTGDVPKFLMNAPTP